MQKPLFIGCDWGSSNFRVALITRDGDVSAEYADARGIVALRQQGFERDGLVLHLQNGLERLAERTAFDLSSLPLMISGMAGSSLGICEVPYAQLPFSVSGEGLIPHQVGPFSGIPNPVSIISGVCSEDDVMRGEETEAIGLMNGIGLKDALLILPGTHSKHLRIINGRIIDLKTYMTGELFQVISAQTILRHAMHAAHSDPFDDGGRTCFLEGLEMARSSDWLHELFTLRSRVLLNRLPVTGNIHRLSGWLIGSELLQLHTNKELPIVLGGEGTLSGRYQLALQYMGLSHRLTDIPDQICRRAVWNGQILLHSFHHTDDVSHHISV